MNNLNMLRVNSTLDDIKHYDWVSFLQLLPMFRPLAAACDFVRVNIINKDEIYIVHLSLIRNSESIGDIYFRTDGHDPINDFLSQINRMTPNKEQPSFIKK